MDKKVKGLAIKDEEETPLVNKEYLLKKFPGKGGWTYAELPEVVQDKTKPFGWVTVRGFIDDYPLNQYKLLPMGEGRLFLPVKAVIRKELNKGEGDSVHIVLYPDQVKVVVPHDLLDCFELEEQSVYTFFTELTESEKKAYLDWINEGKREETKVNRIAEMMERLSKQLKFYD